MNRKNVCDNFEYPSLCDSPHTVLYMWKRDNFFLAQWSLFEQIGSARYNCAEKKSECVCEPAIQYNMT